MRWWMFELAIWIFLIATGAALVEIFTTHGRKIKKSSTLLMSVLVLIVVWGAVFYGSFVEPKILAVRHESYPLFSSGTSLRAVLVSDTHVGPYKTAVWIDEIVKKTNAERPDIIFLLGDYILGAEGDVFNLDGFGNLSAPLGVYAILGNHDYDNEREAEVQRELESLGIRVLRNENDKIDLPNGQSFYLAGASDMWHDADLEKTFSGLMEDDKVIFLAHNPDAILEPETQPADLMLSGHTHGGQIRLPFFGAVSKIPTRLGQKFGEGWFEMNNIDFFITSGTGEMGPRARLFNPPEIVILELN
jgi:predicted MPP superfamily phosphohydrolase